MRKGFLTAVGSLAVCAGSVLGQDPEPIIDVDAYPKISANYDPAPEAAPGQPEPGEVAPLADSPELPVAAAVESADAGAAKPAPEATPAPSRAAAGPVLLAPPGHVVGMDCTAAPCCPQRCWVMPGARYWAQVDYLLWWLSDSPVPVPLVTTGPDGSGGVIGREGTRVLFGGESQDLGAFSGGRVTAGGWLDCRQTIGLEASGFLLEQQSFVYNVSSDAAGLPLLSVPYINVAPGAAPSEDSIIISRPGSDTGGVGVTGSTRLWGAEVSGVANLWRTCRVDLDMVAGFRYLDLRENLYLYDRTNEFFNGGVFGTDFFDTRNRFYGGHIGVRGALHHGKIHLTGMGRVALGSTEEVVQINGSAAFPGLGVTEVGDIFAVPTNIGTYTDNRFTAIPEVQLQVAYDVTCHLRVFGGYNFLFWPSVVRPGNQIDRVVNSTQIPGAFGPPPAVLVGDPRPVPLNSRSEFFAHGLNFGAEIRY